MRYVQLLADLIRMEEAWRAESGGFGSTDVSPEAWAAWQKTWRASADECCRHFAEQGEWIVLSDELRAAIWPRIVWARHMAALLALPDAKDREVIPAPRGPRARARLIHWLLVDSWHQLGVDWTRHWFL